MARYPHPYLPCSRKKDGKMVFYITDDENLYRVSVPDGSPERIAPDLVLMPWITPVWLGE